MDRGQLFSANILYFMIQYGGLSSGYQVYILTRRKERHESRRKSYSWVGVREPEREGRQGWQDDSINYPWLDSHLREGSNRNRLTPHLLGFSLGFSKELDLI